MDGPTPSEPPARRLLDLAFLLVGLTGLLVCAAVLVPGAVHGLSPRRWLLAGLAALVFLGCRALRSSHDQLLRERVGFAVSSVLVVEVVFQVLALLGLLPAVEVASYTPYGRMLYPAEGRGHGTNNRYGWYSPRSDYEDPHAFRVALVGDSFVRGRHVDRDDTLGARLDARLQEDGSRFGAAEALAFGMSGAGPAEYEALMEHVVRRHSPDLILLFVFLGNDFRNCIETLRADPGTHLRYRLAPDGSLSLDPASLGYHERFREALGSRHRGLLHQAPRILASHLMLGNVARTLFEARGLLEPHRPSRTRGAPEGWSRLGLDTAGYDEDPLSVEARQVMGAFVERFRRFGHTSGVRVALVTIPHFSAAFYADFPGPDWYPVVSGRDLLGPERFLERTAEAVGIPLLALGRELQLRRVPPETIRKLYLHSGTGHFSRPGHAFFADIVFERLLSREIGPGPGLSSFAEPSSVPATRGGATR